MSNLLHDVRDGLERTYRRWVGSDHPARRVWLSVMLGALLCVIALAGCYGSTPPMVKIGLIAPFEELYRADGYAALHAVKLAIAQRNAAGGVAGRQVVLVALNDNGRSAEAAMQAAKLAVDGDVFGVIGPLQIATTAAAAPVLAAHRLAWIAPLPLAGRACSGGFSLFAAPEAVGRKAVDVLADAGVTGLVAVFADQPGTLAGAQAAAARHDLPVAVHSLAASASLPPAVQGAIWLGDAAGAARLARKLAPEAGVVVGGPEVGSPVFAGRAGADAAATRYLSSGLAVEALPEDFVAAYRDLAGVDPTPQAVLVYDAARLFLDALAQVGAGQRTLDRETVRRAVADLGQDGWQGLSGRVHWSLEQGGCWQWKDAALNVYTLEYR